MTPHNWTDERVAELRRLWAEGVPASEIGRRLGVTKNAVIGKADRLPLPARKEGRRTGGAAGLATALAAAGYRITR